MMLLPESTMESTLFSYSLPLPDSIGSVHRLEQIDESIELKEGSNNAAMVFKNYRDVTPQNYRGKKEEIHTYVAIKNNPIIPSSHEKGAINVYKAAVISTSFDKSDRSTSSHTVIRDTFVTLKVADDQESILKLKEQVTRSAALHVDNDPCDNINRYRFLHVETCFTDEQSGKFCAVICSSPLLGSLRTIMKNSFPKGFSEDLIQIALRKIVKPLRILHRHHFLHGDINAGHVYLFGTQESSNFFSDLPRISLGFAAGVYDDDDDDDDDDETYLPKASMSNWAAAPEVYNEKKPYTEKADIWLVGITALELIYGGLKFANREALEALIKKIHDKKKLPAKNWVNLKIISDEVIIERAAPDMTRAEAGARAKAGAESRWGYYWNFLGMSSSYDDNGDDSSSYDDDSPFSDVFTNMVMQCLAWDPEKRPNVDELLSDKFFSRSFCRGRGGRYFYDVVMNKRTSMPTA